MNKIVRDSGEHACIRHDPSPAVHFRVLSPPHDYDNEYDYDEVNIFASSRFFVKKI